MAIGDQIQIGKSCRWCSRRTHTPYIIEVTSVEGNKVWGNYFRDDGSNYSGHGFIWLNSPVESEEFIHYPQ